MVEWQGEAIVLNAVSHGESGLIVHVLTRELGRTAGMVRGVKKHGAVCQMGNVVEVTWKARLEEQLGQFAPIESKLMVAPTLVSNPTALAAMSGLCTMLYKLLPERDPHPRLYDALVILLQSMRAGGEAWHAHYVAFELLLLQEIGHGLQLNECAACGTSEDLCYVSPKSGAAVSRAQGEIYKARLLPLPKMLAPDCPHDYVPRRSEIIDGLCLTGYFLGHHMDNHYHIALPDSRERFIKRLQVVADD